MRNTKLSRKFIKHMGVTDVILCLFLFLYDLLSLVIPIAHIKLGGIIMILLLVDLCLVIIKLINNFDFSTNG